MAQSETGNDGVYRFDQIVVEPLAHRIERDGQPLALEPKAYTLLLILLRHAGELVGKDMLLDSIWGHRHVTPGVLNHVVSQLRHSLGDSSAKPRYIATVHSLGYRFIGQLQAGPAPATGHAEPPQQRRLTDGDQVFNVADLQPCLNQMANWAAMLPAGDIQRQAIQVVLKLEYERLRERGIHTPTLLYHEARLAALDDNRAAATSLLEQAISAGFRDEAALRFDLAWHPLAGDTDFRRQLQRLQDDNPAPSA